MLAIAQANRVAPIFNPSLVPTLMKTKVVLFLCLFLSLTTYELSAATMKVLADFVPAPQGETPNGLVLAHDGNFYGSTSGGSASGLGTLFRLSPSGSLTTLVSFTGPNGISPNSLLEGPDGNLYGTTYSGGARDMGTIFRLSLTGEFKTIAFFDGTNGAHPISLLVAQDGNFYGTTLNGGTANVGTIFRLPPAGQLTTLVSFTKLFEVGPFIQGQDGNFYGTPFATVSLSPTAIFKVTPQGVKTTLFTFNATSQALGLSHLVQAADGNFYGVTHTGGTHNAGIFFKLTAKGVLSTLKSFTTGQTGNGVGSFILGKDGQLYGTILRDAGSNNDIFKLTLTGGFSTFASFSDNFLRVPGSLIQDTQGNFYGTDAKGGAAELGSIFKLTLQRELSTIAAFPKGKNGADPSSVLLAKDGNLYGTTRAGGNFDGGTFFKITPTDGLITLSSFTAATGTSPNSGLIQALDGNFYGTAQEGGPAGYGTLFKVTASGAITRLVNFNGKNGANPQAGVIQAKDGNLYGTTLSSAFKWSPSGLQTLAVFDLASYGTSLTGLLQGRDGNFYGTTQETNLRDDTSIFKLTATGELTRIYQTPSSSLQHPIKGTRLVEDSAGNLYGVMDSIFAPEQTNVFKLTPAHNFTPFGRLFANDLILGTDGNFYGTRVGTDQIGLIVRLTPKGADNYLSAGEGSGSYATYIFNCLVEGADGNFYGTGNRVLLDSYHHGIATGSGLVFGLTLKSITTQTISFPAIGPVTVGQTITLNATASSGLPVTFQVLSGPATISGNKLTITGPGSVKVAATQAGSLKFAEKEVVQNLIAK